MVKIFLKMCLLSVLFMSQSFAQSKESSHLNKAPKIASSINPIYQIARFISGDDKSNYLLINPNTSEHDYQFRSSDINTLNKADVVFYIDDNLENNFAKVLRGLEKQPKTVQLARSKYVKLITFQSRFSEDSIDYHIWLSPANAIGIAMEIAHTLSALYPPSAPIYKKNLEQFVIDIKDMDEKNKIKLLAVQAKSFVVDHNSIVYFESYYSLPAAGVMRYYHNQILPIKDIKRINNLIKENRASCVLGSFQEKSSLVAQIAFNNKTKLILVDIMGSELNYDQNGYTKMISNLVDDLVRCVKPSPKSF